MSVVRRVCSIGWLAALLAAPPWALVRFVGNPLPTAIPDPAGMVGSIERSGVDPAVLVRVIAVVIWIAWARLAIAVVVELVARAGGRPVPRIPGLGSSQRWAASLLASATLAGGGFGLPGGAGALDRGPEPVVAAWSGGALVSDGSELAAIPSGGAPTVPSPGPGPASPGGATWTVVRNDSWWRIAEQALGDGLRWQEVRDANLGREVAPGVRFTSPDRSLQPGWTVVLPGGAPLPSSGAGPAPTADSRPAAEIAVRAGDSLSSIARDRLGDEGAWPVLWEANRGRSFADGAEFDDPDELRPGWVLVLPSQSAPVTAADAVAAEAATAPALRHGFVGSVAVTSPTVASSAVEVSCAPMTTDGAPAAADGAATGAGTAVPVASSPSPSPSSVGADADADAEVDVVADDDRSVTPLGVAAATVLATAGLGVVRFRRRQQLRSCPVGASVPPPEPAVMQFERRLVAASAEEVVARLDLAVRGAVAELARRAAEGVTPPPFVAALTSADGSVELRFDGHAPTPVAPFVACAGGWELAAGVPTSSIPPGGRFAAFPCPALVHVGRVDDRDLHIDLEAVGTFGIEGSRRHARAVLDHLLGTVALAPYGSRCRTVTCGLPDRPLTAADADEDHAELDDALERAAELVGPVLGVLRPGHTAALLRAGSAGEPWETVVLAAAAERVTGPAGAELVELGASPGRGLAVVTDCPAARTRWKLRQLDRSWRLDPIGLDVEPVGVEAPDLRALGALVESAGRVPPTVRSGGGPAVDPGPAPVAPPRDWVLMVHTLGRPRVTTRDGAEVEFTRSKALELVVWLGRHRRLATRSGARAALWDVEVANGTFANVVSDARHALAAAVEAPDGELWLGRSVGERMELHLDVVSDVEVLQAALERARRLTSREARAELSAALKLVAGAPFTAVGYSWPDAEGLVTQDTLLATTVAAELAELCLAAGDLDGVFDATGVGLLVLPGHEELLALRMRAQAARGDLASVKREWEGYERVIAGDPLGDGEPSARLVQLRNDLLGSRRR